MTYHTDLTGKVFGRLTVLRHNGSTPAGASRWECRCECGTIKTITGFKLTQGKTKSCGCWRRDNATTHGMSRLGRNTAVEYTVWEGMIHRCTNPRHRQFHRYGGRGITVCDRWRDSFEGFLADMGKRPSPKHTIDRQNNDGNYEPSNCCWATRRTQAQNRAGNVHVEWNGLRLTISEWSRRLGIHKGTLRSRLLRLSIAEAFTMPRKGK